MTDLSSAWFAVGGTLIGVVGTQTAVVIKAFGKGRARKLKNQRDDTAAKAAKRRELYEQLIGYVDKAELLTAKVVATMKDDHKDHSYAYASAFDEVLEPVRSACISVQIDGSDRAMKIATGLLADTRGLWHLASVEEEVYDHDQDTVEAVHEALSRAHADMVEAARADFGG